MTNQSLQAYVLQLADNGMVIGQRLGEWCGHAPNIEIDIALTNLALDHIGEAKLLYQYAAQLDTRDIDEDFFPYTRVEREWRNILLVERPNDDFAHTIVRQFLYDCYHYYYMTLLQSSSDTRLAEIAAKSVKEAAYHLRFSSNWMKRLGDGTDESHRRMQAAMEDLMIYFDEAFMPSTEERTLIDQGVAVDYSKIEKDAKQMLKDVCDEATLDIPEVSYAQKGGKNGLHTEDLGHLLSELQYLQKTYPGSTW